MASADPAQSSPPAWTPLATGLCLSLTCISVLAAIIVFVAILKWISPETQTLDVKASAPGGMSVEIKRQIADTNLNAFTQIIQPIQNELNDLKAFKARVEAANGKLLSQSIPPIPPAPAQPPDVIPEALAEAVLAGDKDLYRGVSGFIFVGSLMTKPLSLDGSPVDPEQLVVGKTYVVRLTVTLREAMPSSGDAYYHSVRAKGLAAIGQKIKLLSPPRGYPRRNATEYWAQAEVVGS